MKRVIKLTFQIIAAVLVLVLLAGLITGGAIALKGMGSKGHFTYMIVLGTTVEGTQPSSMLRDRINAAAKYMQTHEDVIAVVTGGKADKENISEAQCMFNELVALGIAPERIIMETQATSTVENFEYSLQILDEQEGRRLQNIGVLSSEFHLLRASMLAKHHDLTPITIAAHTSDTQSFLTYFLREIFMVWYDGIRLLFL